MLLVAPEWLETLCQNEQLHKLFHGGLVLVGFILGIMVALIVTWVVLAWKGRATASPP